MSTARRILEILLEEGVAARAHFQTWWALRNVALPTHFDTMNDCSYVDFFHASNAGHYKLFLLALSKMFDRDDRAAGLKALREALRQEGFPDVAESINRDMSPHTRLVARLMHIRNRTIVHNEFAVSRDKVYDISGVTPNQIRDLIDLTCRVLNDAAHRIGINNTIFDNDRHEQAVLRLLEKLGRGRRA